MIPLKDNLPSDRAPVLTLLLIAANAIVYFAVQGGGIGHGPDSAPALPAALFAHAGLLDLLGGLLFLWLFGSTVEGEVKNSTEFGLFIGLDNDVDGMVHMSDIAWGVSGEDALNLHRKGETVQAIVLDVDPEKERISLGMKQLERGAPVVGGATAGDRLSKNQVVTVTVLEVRDAGLEVQAGDDGATGFIKRTDLGRDRDEQRPERFQVGQKFDAMVTGFDRSKKPTFSVKAMQISEEKQAVAQYGSSDSGASLGDILGEALKARQNKQ